MCKWFVHILALFALGSSGAFAQKNPIIPTTVDVLLTEGTIMPEIDPIVTGSTGLRAPETPAPLNFEKCDADCQAEKLGIAFDE